MVECDFGNIGECVTEQFFGYFNDLINSAISPILSTLKNMLITNIDLTPFFSIWKIMLWTMSFFYIIVLVYCGITLMHSGSDPIKRNKSKNLLQNIIILIIVTSISYFFYDALLEIVSSMIQMFYTYVDESFLYINSGSNFALDLVLSVFYLIILLLTVALVGLRNFVVTVSVVLLPFALFLYSVPMVKTFGKLIINSLLAFTMLPIVNIILLIAASKIGGSTNSLFLPLITFIGIDIIAMSTILFVIFKSAMEIKNTHSNSVTKLFK